MALIDPCLYIQADAHPARTFRQLITAMLAEGILGSTSFAVTQRGAGANFSVDVAAGMGVVTGDSATQQGRYLVVNDATVNDASTVITSAPSAGNERYDRVILEVKDHAEDASGINAPRFRVVAGTPATVVSGTAAPPALPNTAITLAIVGPIQNGTTTITNSLIVDGRTASALGNQLVNTAAIVDANVTTAKILDANVTLAKLAADSVNSSKIVNGSIVEGDLNAAVLSSSWLAASLTAGNTGNFFYKKIGNVVFVMIEVIGGGSNPIATLPAGYRPSFQYRVTLRRSASSDAAQLVINTNGTCNLDWLGSTSDTYSGSGNHNAGS